MNIFVFSKAERGKSFFLDHRPWNPGDVIPCDMSTPEGRDNIRAAVAGGRAYPEGWPENVPVYVGTELRTLPRREALRLCCAGLAKPKDKKLWFFNSDAFAEQPVRKFDEPEEKPKGSFATRWRKNGE